MGSVFFFSFCLFVLCRHVTGSVCANDFSDEGHYGDGEEDFEIMAYNNCIMKLIGYGGVAAGNVGGGNGGSGSGGSGGSRGSGGGGSSGGSDDSTDDSGGSRGGSISGSSSSSVYIDGDDNDAEESIDGDNRWKS